MLHYPFNETYPVAIQLGPLAVHWYGIMYLIGFAAAWLLGVYRADQSQGLWTRQMVGDLVFYCMLGVILGGRIGYMLFYNFSEFLTHPVFLFKIWEGGMAFHGGLLGVMMAMWLFAKHSQKSFSEVADFTAPLVPLGLAAGRLGNFINGELWGRVTHQPWGVIFPHVDQLPRHPSQLYEFFCEGILLFLMVWIFSAKRRPPLAISGLFALGYGVFRFTLEFFRLPDQQYGFIAFNWLTMGQLLSLPMILGGAALIILAYLRTGETRYV